MHPNKYYCSIEPVVGVSKSIDKKCSRKSFFNLLAVLQRLEDFLVAIYPDLARVFSYLLLKNFNFALTYVVMKTHASFPEASFLTHMYFTRSRVYCTQRCIWQVRDSRSAGSNNSLIIFRRYTWSVSDNLVHDCPDRVCRGIKKGGQDS